MIYSSVLICQFIVMSDIGICTIEKSRKQPLLYKIHGGESCIVGIGQYVQVSYIPYTDIFPLICFNKAWRSAKPPLLSTSKKILIFFQNCWNHRISFPSPFIEKWNKRHEKTVSRPTEAALWQILQLFHEPANIFLLWIKMLVLPLQFVCLVCWNWELQMHQVADKTRFWRLRNLSGGIVVFQVSSSSFMVILPYQL